MRFFTLILSWSSWKGTNKWVNFCDSILYTTSFGNKNSQFSVHPSRYIVTYMNTFYWLKECTVSKLQREILSLTFYSYHKDYLLWLFVFWKQSTSFVDPIHLDVCLSITPVVVCPLLSVNCVWYLGWVDLRSCIPKVS